MPLGVEKKFFLKGILYFHYITYETTPEHNSPFDRVMKFTILVDLFFGHTNYILGLSFPCLGEENIFKEIKYIICLTSMVKPQNKNLCPGCHEIYKSVRPLFGHNYYTLSSSEPCHGVENFF